MDAHQHDRVEAALAGELQMSELTVEESADYNARLDAAISAAAPQTSFVDRLRARGITTVIRDDDGTMTRIHPDGTRSKLR